MTSTRSYRGMHRTWTLLLGALTLALGTACGADAAGPAAAPAASQGVPSDAVLRNFEISGDFQLAIDGKDLPKAEIYLSATARAYILMASELPSPVLVSAATQSIDTIDLMKVAKQPNGTIDLLADAVLEPAGKYAVDGPNMTFTYAGKKVRLTPRPHLVGKHTGAELLAGNPAYSRKANAYTPDAAILKRLKAQKEPVRVLTLFGSWCPFCSAHVPLLLKVEQSLAGSKIQFEYLGMPKGKEFAEVPEAKEFKVTGVPTSILFVGGKEIGRIPTSQWSNPEVALDLQLNGPKASQ